MSSGGAASKASNQRFKVSLPRQSCGFCLRQSAKHRDSFLDSLAGRDGRMTAGDGGEVQSRYAVYAGVVLGRIDHCVPWGDEALRRQEPLAVEVFVQVRGVLDRFL